MGKVNHTKKTNIASGFFCFRFGFGLFSVHLGKVSHVKKIRLGLFMFCCICFGFGCGSTFLIGVVFPCAWLGEAMVFLLSAWSLTYYVLSYVFAKRIVFRFVFPYVAAQVSWVNESHEFDAMKFKRINVLICFFETNKTHIESAKAHSNKENHM